MQDQWQRGSHVHSDVVSIDIFGKIFQITSQKNVLGTILPYHPQLGTSLLEMVESPSSVFSGEVFSSTVT